ncbi:MAG: ABC transporter permease [Dorea sp.]
MIRKLIKNDIRNNPLFSFMTVFFMTVSAMLLALTVLLFSSLLTSMGTLMTLAETPDYLQMHMGEIEENRIAHFAEKNPQVRKWQICGFLNLENSQISLGGHNLADSTQDNGLYVQGEKFDYLLDTQNQVPEVSVGEVYVPVCYRSMYDLNVGERMKIGEKELTIAGFVRDSQMNSMMSSSKRFLVNAEDYHAIWEMGEEEYLIEFLLKEHTDMKAFAAGYAAEGLPANGPAITKPLIRMMNALSDGMMILVIFLVSIVVFIISMLCIYFILALQMEKDRKEVGLLKALGISGKDIRNMYFAKYVCLSGTGALVGYLLAFLLQGPLMRQMQELYGASRSGWLTMCSAFVAVILTEGLLLLLIRHNLKKTEKYTVSEAISGLRTQKKRAGSYLFIGLVLAAGAFLMLVPQNLYSTMSSPQFVTYMGIGDGEIRIDVRQTEEIGQITEQMERELESDVEVEKYVVLRTQSYAAALADGSVCNLTIETGDHSVFPVSYMEGTMPEKEAEIALSAANAEELGLYVGDTLQLIVGDEKKVYTVSGIYSDITNGGKTAKAAFVSQDAPVIWSVLYVSLKDTAEKENWMSSYQRTGADIVDISDYVEKTYGQTLRQIRLAGIVTIGMAAGIILAVTALFMRLITERNRYEISLQKALGFTGASVRKQYMKNGMLYAAVGLVVGLLAGNLCGEGLCGILLQSFGAYGFQFVIAWKQLLVLIPLTGLAAAGMAVWMGTREISRIKAYECCIGKE